MQFCFDRLDPFLEFSISIPLTDRSVATGSTGKYPLFRWHFLHFAPGRIRIAIIKKQESATTSPFHGFAKMTDNLFDIHEHTLSTLDECVRSLVAEFGQWMACRPGCSGCCRDGFKIRYIEALHLLKGFALASPEVADMIMRNIRNSPTESAKSRCPLLHEDACLLYSYRPAICRAFGVIIRLDGNVGTCDLNFNDPPKDLTLKTLDIEPFYELLEELSDRLWANFPNPALSEGSDSPMWSIRTHFEKFLSGT